MERDASMLANLKGCRTYYELLGVPPTAHLDDIKKAFRKRVLLLHPDRNRTDPEAAAELFGMVQVAYNTLSHDDLRDRYDASLQAAGEDHRQPLGLLEGNEIWQAFEVMQKFRADGFSLLSKVSEIEKKHGVPEGQLRFREGVPCAGYESGCRRIERLSKDECCTLIEGAGKKAPQEEAKRRVLLCHKHNYLHMCDGDTCTAEEQVCPLYASFLVELWREARKKRWKEMFSGNWTVEISSSNLPYWFNKQTRSSIWVDEWERGEVMQAFANKDALLPSTSALDEGSADSKPQANSSAKSAEAKSADGGPRTLIRDEEGEEEKHVCTFAVCSAHGFERLDHDIWVCRLGKVPHMCTRLQCHLTRREQDGVVACWATKKVYAVGQPDEEGYAKGDYEASALPEDKEAAAVGASLRKLTYINETTGRVVTTEVEVPYGLKLDFSGPNLIEYSTSPSPLAPGKRGRPEDFGEDDTEEAQKRRKDVKRIKKMEFALNEEKRREREELKLEEQATSPQEEPDDTKEEQEKELPDVKSEPANESQSMPLPPSHPRARLRQIVAEKEQGKLKREQGEEDIYAHAEDTIYSIYGGSLDLFGHRRDEEWETIQGFAGGFEGAQEEEEEDRDVELEAKEMKTQSQMRLEYKAKKQVRLIQPKKE